MADKVIDQLAEILRDMPSGQLVEATGQTQQLPPEMENGDFQAELSSRLDAILGKIG